jgi:hypothetical protein
MTGLLLPLDVWLLDGVDGAIIGAGVGLDGSARNDGRTLIAAITTPPSVVIVNAHSAFFWLAVSLAIVWFVA